MHLQNWIHKSITVTEGGSESSVTITGKGTELQQ